MSKAHAHKESDDPIEQLIGLQAHGEELSELAAQLLNKKTLKKMSPEAWGDIIWKLIGLAQCTGDKLVKYAKRELDEQGVTVVPRDKDQ